jgi:hypothetical protein
MTNITYAITVCNEEYELQRLLNYLEKHLNEQDNIVILYDKKNGTTGVEDFLRSYTVNKNYVRWHYDEFDGDFAKWKNKLKKLCDGEYIFFLDADEYPNKYLLSNINSILKDNVVDIIFVPRINTLKGDEKQIQEYIKSQNWNIDNEGKINYPDYQGRIVYNKSYLGWSGKVHERIIGYKLYAFLPLEEEFSLYHPKTLEKQIKQNTLYNTL